MYWSNHGHVRFRVFCNVTVTVKELPHQAVLQSASLRLMGVTDEQFISEGSNVSSPNLTLLTVEIFLLKTPCLRYNLNKSRCPELRKARREDCRRS
ncbi:hypothetical protein J6590_097277 [Homalodisca vitripennis]|nr:hypothetical protein J6590_097277 [Homalodisca vitripennis]